MGRVTRLVHSILQAAVKKGARAIEMHDDPDRARALVSLEIDGAWVPEMLSPYRLRDQVAETLANLAASPGWFEYAIDGRTYRFHVDLGDGSDASIFRIDIRPVI